MKKTNRISRLLAMLLALAMLVNSQGMTSMAAVIGGVTGGRRQTEAPQTEAETEALQTETEVQTEVKQTETEAQTEAQTEAKQTETAAETEAETEAPQTETETELESESEGLSPAETEGMTETEALTETESETELETEEIVEEETEAEAGVYTYEDEKVTVTATVSDPTAFEEGTMLVVKEFEPSEDEIAQMQAGLEEGKVLFDTFKYDIHFEYEGLEIEPPEGVTVDVKIDRHSILEQEQTAEADAGDIDMVLNHVKDNGEIESISVDDATVLENGEIKDVSFATESFSVFVGGSGGDAPTLTINIDGLEDKHECGSIYIALKGSGRQIAKELKVKNGNYDPVVIQQMCNDDGKETDGLCLEVGTYEVIYFLYRDKAPLSQKVGEITAAQQGSNQLLKSGSYVFESCKLTGELPTQINIGPGKNELTLTVEPQGKSENKGSYSEVERLLGVANDFGAFTKEYYQSADTESTVAAQSAEVNANFNFSSNNFKNVNNVIEITKTYTNENGNPVNNKEVTINLYREGTLVDTVTATTGGEYTDKLHPTYEDQVDTDGNPLPPLIIYEKKQAEDGKAYFYFDHLISGTYTFYEVIDGTEVKGNKVTEDGVHVTYSNTVTINGSPVTYDADANTHLEIAQTNFNNYSYFGSVNDNVFNNNLSRGGYVVLGSTEWTTRSQMSGAEPVGEDAFRYNGTIFVREGSNGFKIIDFDTEFDRLIDASTTISQMSNDAASANGAVVYYLSRDQLEHKSSALAGLESMNFDSHGNKYIIVNVNMSGPNNDEFKFGGGFSIDGEAVKADFVSQDDARILWNFYDYDERTPYTGSVRLEGKPMTGVYLLPCSEVSGASGNLGGTIIAKKYTHSSGEVHGVSPDVNSQNATGSVSNSFGEQPQTGAVYIEKNVTVNDVETTSDLVDGTYEFEILDENRNPLVPRRIVSVTIDNGVVVAGGYVDGLAPGRYNVHELLTEAQENNGIKLTGKEYVEVTVEAGVTTNTDKNVARFTNNRDTTVDVVFKVEKEFDGDPDKSFTVELTGVEREGNTPPMPTTGNAVTVTAGQTVSFGGITYDKSNVDREYVYHIAETNTAEADIIYDKTKYEVKVTINGNDDGRLSADVKYRKAGEEAWNPVTEEFAFQFKNVKEKKGSLYIEKNVTVNRSELPESAVKTIVDGDYYFNIYKSSDGNRSNPVRENIKVTVKDGKSATVEVQDLEAGQYVVAERLPSENGATLTSGNDKVVTVTEGQTEQVKLGEGSALNTASFTNNRDVSVDAQFAVTKTFTNGASDKEFTVKLTGVEKDGKMPPMPASTPAVVKVSQVTSASFGQITYTEAGDYFYEISEREDNPAADGVVYDDTVYEVWVDVDQNPDGTLSSVVKYREKSNAGDAGWETADSAFTFNFTNEQLGKLSVTKVVVDEGGKALADATYTVTVTPKTDVEQTIDMSGVTATATRNGVATNVLEDATENSVTFTFKADETVTLNNLPKGTYTIVEEKGDGDKFITTYKVDGLTSDNSATVEVNPTEAVAEAEIINTYTKDTELSFKGTKALVNGKLQKKELTGGEYNFKIEQLLTGYEGMSTAAAVIAKAADDNDKDGNFSFGPVTFSEAGIYYFKVTETTLSTAEVEADSRAYIVKVVVAANANNTEYVVTSVQYQMEGKADWTDLSAEASEPATYKLPDYSAGEGSDANATFINREKKGYLEITKVVQGEEEAFEKDFYFQVSQGTGDNKVYFDENGEESEEPVTLTLHYDAANSEENSLTVSNLMPGEYTVTEVDENGNPVSADAYYPYAVNGDGEVTVAARETTDVTVTNTKINGKITVKKKVAGTTDEETVFHVGLFKENDEGQDVFVDGSDQDITASREVTYENLAPGEYAVYEVYQNEDGAWVKLENGSITGNYVVTNDGETVELSTSDYEKHVDLVNTYYSTKLELKGHKIAENIGDDDDDSVTFNFELLDSDETTVATGSYTTNKENTDTSFDITPALTYELEDLNGEESATFYYTLKESVDGVDGNGYKGSENRYYDIREKQLVVTVACTENAVGNVTGIEVTSVTIDGKSASKVADDVWDLGEENAFVNFEANEAELQIPVQKRIEGPYEYNADKDNDKTFTFTLRGANDYTDTVTINASEIKDSTGLIQKFFKELTFDKAGIYTYELTEEAVNEDGFTCDQNTYTITVEVALGTGEHEHDLVVTSAEWTNADGTESGFLDLTGETVTGGPTFVNEYSVGTTSTELGVKKTATAEDGVTIPEATFTFKLTGNGTVVEENPSTIGINGYDKIEGETKEPFIDKTVTLKVGGDNPLLSGNFPEIYFDKAGTYTYTLKEQSGTYPGWSLDGSEYEIKITVTDDGKGNLSATKEYKKTAPTAAAWEDYKPLADDVQVEFTNTYNVSDAEAQLSVEKEITGPWPTENKRDFHFTLSDAGSEVTDGYKVVKSAEPETDSEAEEEFGGMPQQVTVSGEGEVSFDKFVFSKPGSYYFALVEDDFDAENPGYTGYKKDEKSYWIWVEVTDDHEGRLSASVSYKEQTDNTDNMKEADGYVSLNDSLKVTFTNTYTETGTDYQFGAKKVVETLPVDATVQRQFRFTVKPLTTAAEDYGYVEGDGKLEKITDDWSDTVTLTVGGKAPKLSDLFAEIHYDHENTYQYLVTEEDFTAEDALGYTKDAKTYVVTVNVTRKAEDNSLSASATYAPQDETGEGWPKPLTGTDIYVAFTNTYKAADTELRIPVKKTVKGISNEKAEGKKFTFGLFKAGEDEATLIDTAEVVIGSNGAGEAAFKELFYSVDKKTEAGKLYQGGVGTYHYAVRELTTENGFDMDATIYQITVEITDDGSGQLKKTVTVEQAEKVEDGEKTEDDETTESEAKLELKDIAFVNNYEAEGFDDVLGVKSVPKKAQLQEFTFGAYMDEAGTQPAPVENVNPTAANNTTNGSFKFKFQYTMEDLKDGEEYLSDKKFTYYILEENFAADEHTGYKRDGSVYRVTVTVTDLGSGQLAVFALLEKKTDETDEEGEPIWTEVTAADFINDYEASASWKLGGEKTINSGDIAVDQKRIESLNGKVQFVLNETDKDGKVKETIATKTLTLDEEKKTGVFSFNKLSYTLEDAGSTYYYQVVEQKTVADAKMGGYTVDETVYRYSVFVEDLKNGTLRLTIRKLNADGTTDDDPVVIIGNSTAETDDITVSFDNTYHATGLGKVEGTKALTGRELKDNEFTFAVEDEAQHVLAFNKNRADGGFYIGGIGKWEDGAVVPFTEKDAGKTFKYKLYEVKGSLAGIKYATDSYGLTVTVTDNGDGTLDVDVEVVDGPAVFTNTYDTLNWIALKAKKEMEGRELTAEDVGKFTFTLTADDDEYAHTINVAAATNGADGTVDFGTHVVTIKLADMAGATETPVGSKIYKKQFAYTLTETGEVDGVSNAEAKSLTLEATYNEKTGTLSLDWLNDADDLTFVNTYDTEAKIGLNVEKKLTGRQLKKGEFSFKLEKQTGANGRYTSWQTIATKTNDENGKVDFGADVITIKLADMADAKETETGSKIYKKQFTYALSETPTSETGVKNDPVSYRKLTLEATYDKNTGDLTLTWLDGMGSQTFVNTYDTQEKTGVELTKELTGLDLTAGAFTFKLEKQIGANGRFTSWKTIATTANSADGKASFADAIVITLDDLKINDENTADSYQDKTFTYRVSEVKPEDADPAMIYDEEVYTFTVDASYDFGTGVLTLTNRADPSGYMFENEWTAEASVPLNGHKTLKDLTLEAGKYNFRVYKAETVTVADGKIFATADPVLSATNDADGNVTFGSLTYDLDDIKVMKDGKATYPEETIFEYKVLEVKGSDTGITYDPAVKTVQVKVTYDSANGELKAELVNAEGIDLTFKNEYDTETEIGFEAAKEMHGRDLTAEDVSAYKFTLTADDEAYAGTVKTKEVTIDNAETGAITGFKDDAIKITLDDMVDELEGSGRDGIYMKEFKYTLTESGSRPSVTNDPNAKHLTVTATYNKNSGELKLALTKWDNLTFINTYKATGSVPAEGSKLVNSKPLTQAQIERLNKLVRFQLWQVEDTSVTRLGSKSLDEEGKFSFDALTFDQDDIGKTFTYQMKEFQDADNDELGGYAVDGTVYTFKVTVADSDEHDGTLKLTVTDEAGNAIEGEPKLEAEFNNELTVEFHVNKTEVGDNSKEVAGAELTVYEVTTDENGEKKLTAVEGASWISQENETHDFGDKLEEGKSYVLRETVAPDGYAYTTDIEFSVTDNGEIETAMPTTTGKNGETVYLVEDAPLRFNVNKVDLTNDEELDGAKLTVYEVNENGEIVDEAIESWTSKKGETHDFGSSLKAGGSYVLREEAAPNGYAFTSDIPFTVGEDGTVEADMRTTKDADGETVYLVDDKPLHFNVNKVDLTNDEELDGATLTVYEVDEEGHIVGEAIESWTSQKGETHDFGSSLKAGGRYVLREEAAPDGYAFTSDIPFMVGQDGTVEAEMRTTKNADGETVYLVDDAPLHFNVNKVDLTNDEELDGATLTVYEADENGEIVGEAIESWTSQKGETHDFGSSLKAGGRYVLREEAAPDGYAFTSDIPFTVGEDGTVEADMRTTTNVDGETVYLVDDKPLHFNVNKVDLTNDEELDGATLTVYEVDENGEIVGEAIESWTSKKGETHDFGSSLKAGGSYVLREEAAPNGYAFTSDIPFTVGEDGTVEAEMRTTTNADGETVYLVDDKPIVGTVTLTKLGPDAEKLAGAAFQLYYKTAEADDGYAPYNNASYVTGMDGTLTIGGLTPNDYYFVETQAPEGFEITKDENGEPMKYPFTIELGEDKTKAEVTVTLDVTNAPEAIDTNLVVTKQLVYNNELWNAVDATFYVALFDDETLMNRVSEIQPIEFKNMNTSSTTFENLEVGKTYYVAETTNDGFALNNYGGALATGEMFSVDFYDGNVVTVERGDGTKAIYFRNQFTELPREFYREGELTVTKQLLSADGALKPSNETFYAGIFADAELTTLSKDVSKNIVPLAMNGLSMVSDIVKVTVPENGKTTVYVAEVDATGKPVAGAASFQYDVTVDGATVTMDEENLKASAVITNQEREKESESEFESEETEIHEERSEETEEFVVPSSTKSVKTGDETPIMLYVGLLAAAALLLILALVLKRRKRS